MSTQRGGKDACPLMPWKWASWIKQLGYPVEILSYPTPEDTIMIRRQPGNPTTLIEVPLSEIAAFEPSSHQDFYRPKRHYSDQPDVYRYEDETAEELAMFKIRDPVVQMATFKNSDKI